MFGHYLKFGFSFLVGQGYDWEIQETKNEIGSVMITFLLVSPQKRSKNY